MKNKRLGDMLIEMNYLTYKEVDKAVELQKSTGKRLGEIFIESNLITEENLLHCLEVQTGIKRVHIDDIEIDMEAVTTISEKLARKYNVIPVKVVGKKLLLIMNDPLNIFAEEDVAIASGYQVEIVSAAKEEISDAITKYYARDYIEKATEEMQREVHKEEVTEEQLIQEEELRNSPAVKLIDTIINNTVKAKASDIHIIPYKDKVLVKYRVDGVLRKLVEIPKEPYNAILTRIKILANMNIAERRIPQDGKMIIKVDGNEINFRVSVLPSINGENIVIRILDKGAFTLDKEKLGFQPREIEALDRVIKKPHGIVLVTGPTGSGKTTTLYSLIKDLNNEERNIITIEDPVELQIDGLVQINVNNKANLTFESGLRAMLRQDPDVIMVGEIRDVETAEMSVRAAITGHLVLSTIHTNNAVSTIVRLLDMNLPAYLISACISGVIAQRLVRKLCPDCREAYYSSEYENQLLGIHGEAVRIYKAKGCSKCSNTGYKGRLGIYEILEMNTEIGELINKGASLKEIEGKAINNGMITLAISAREKVIKGVTTIEEMMKVTLTND